MTYRNILNFFFFILCIATGKHSFGQESAGFLNYKKQGQAYLTDKKYRKAIDQYQHALNLNAACDDCKKKIKLCESELRKSIVIPPKKTFVIKQPQEKIMIPLVPVPPPAPPVETTLTKEDSAYDLAIHHGDSCTAESKYAPALEFYKEARKLKPAETYAQKQEKFIKNMIEQDSTRVMEVQHQNLLLEQERLNQMQRKKAQDGLEALKQFENAAESIDPDKLEKELFFLRKFLNLVPNDSVYNSLYKQKSRYNDISRAKLKMKQIRDYWEKTKGSSYQSEVDSIFYTDEELEMKHPGLNIRNLSAEQEMIDVEETEAKEIQQSYKSLLLTERRIKTSSDSSEDIKVFVESIHFARQKIFVKVLIKNSGTTDFITGQMYLSLQKKDGNTKKCLPFFISAHPIVLPGKEFAIIYGAKEVNMKEEDTLLFEISDGVRKKNFSIKISNADYQSEKKKQS